jgi:hypothetical protein
MLGSGILDGTGDMFPSPEMMDGMPAQEPESNHIPRTQSVEDLFKKKYPVV